MWKLFRKLGMVSTPKRAAVQQLAEAAIEVILLGMAQMRRQLSWMPGTSEEWLATTADQLTGRCHGQWFKHP